MTNIAQGLSRPLPKPSRMEIVYPLSNWLSAAILTSNQNGGFEEPYYKAIEAITNESDQTAIQAYGKWILGSGCSRSTTAADAGSTYSLKIDSGSTSTTGIAEWFWGYPYPYAIDYSASVYTDLGSDFSTRTAVYIELLDKDGDAISGTKDDITGIGDISSAWRSITGVSTALPTGQSTGYAGGDAFGIRLANTSSEGNIFFDTVNVTRFPDITATNQAAASAAIDVEGVGSLIVKTEYENSSISVDITVFGADKDSIWVPSYSDTIANTALQGGSSPAGGGTLPATITSSHYHGESILIENPGWKKIIIYTTAGGTAGQDNLHWVLAPGKTLMIP